MQVCYVSRVLSSILLVSTVEGFIEDDKDEFVIRVKTGDLPEIRDVLERYYNARYIQNILPEFYLFKDGRYDKDTSWLDNAMDKNTFLRTKVQQFERIREFTMDSNMYNERVVAASVSSDVPRTAYHFRNCPTYSDMGVEAVWKMGYTGKGVVIAITDIGINTDIPDLQPNIKMELSFNYASNTTDVTPELCYAGYSTRPDHGNNCAGIVGAMKNEVPVCGVGVAYEAGIVATKIFDLTQNLTYRTCSLHSDTSWISQGLKHRLEKVDVYSNSWGAGKDFISSSDLVAAALEAGVNRGRDGKGAVYVFPADYIADPYANSLHTIAVNSVGTNGRSASFSKVCACTLTSAYGESNIHDRCVLHTTSYERGKCTLEFKGTSASTAIVSGIIGLAIKANPELSWRDIQDFIVQASESAYLAHRNYFQVNGAGHRYHPELGFGLLNATKLVMLARTATALPEQLMVDGKSAIIVRGWRRHNPYVKCAVDITCDETCIQRTESVIVKITYSTSDESLDELILTSPSGTDSLFFDMRQSKANYSANRVDVNFKSVNFWGEAAEGQWALILQHRISQGSVKIEKCEITVYGTGFTRARQPHRPPDIGHEYGIGTASAHDEQGHITTIGHPTTEGGKGNSSQESTVHTRWNDDNMILPPGLLAFAMPVLLGCVCFICALCIIKIKQEIRFALRAGRDYTCDFMIIRRLCARDNQLVQDKAYDTGIITGGLSVMGVQRGGGGVRGVW